MTGLYDDQIMTDVTRVSFNAQPVVFMFVKYVQSV